MKLSSPLAVALLTGITFAGSSASANMSMALHKMSRRAAAAQTTPPPGAIEGATESTFTEMIDHGDAATGNFQQRYYINTSANTTSDPNAPVILLLCGEYSCEPKELLSGLDEGGIDEYVQELHANFVILEHRYYGKSQPFTDLSTGNLVYLTTDQAIADIAAFHDLMAATNGWAGKWITIGGSYAGILAAYARVARPDIIAGGLSSSGPVNLQLDFPQYDKHAANAITQACADQVRADVAYFEGALTNPTLMTQLRSDYAVPAGASDLDALDGIESIADGSIQYSQKDAFCAAIQVANSPAAWLAYATSTGATGSGLVSDLSDLKDFDDGTRQWVYQTCTEYGYFQTAYSDPAQSLLPRRVDLNHELEPCRTYFGINGTPDVTKVLKKYTNPIYQDPTVTNILFTNAQDDPWTELGITPSNSTLHAGLNAFEYSVYAHHGDLKPTTATIPQSVLDAKNLFRQLVAQWTTRKPN